MSFDKINPALCWLLLLFVPCLSLSQEIKSSKISPSLRTKPQSYFEDSLHERRYILYVQDNSKAIAALKSMGKGIKNIRTLSDVLIQIEASPKNIQSVIQLLPAVLFIDEMPGTPRVEEGVSSHDFSVNAIYAAHHFFPEINGRNQVVSVKENRMNPEDIDLKGRYLPSAEESSTGSTHATVMTTLISGAENSFFKGKGVAPKSKYSSSDFALALPDTLSYYQDLEIATQNHSYGIGIQNYYGAHAMSFDLSVNRLERLTHVFSAGNAGNMSASDGAYAGIQGYANLTGNMKMAKNIIVVGAVDSFGVVPELSSKGPAYDGRVKPDLVAFAEDGTSGSAALVSGATLLLQQRYREIFGDFASADLIRALLINSADDIGEPGPDFSSGFGKLNLYGALTTLIQNHFFKGNLVSNDTKEFSLQIPTNIHHIKITLSWNDTAAAPGAARALINDLDLELIHEGNGKTWLPWVLNSNPITDSLRKTSVRQRDSLNNNEQITLEDPVAGNYIIRIKSGDILTTSQNFSVCYQVDTLNNFTWTYPTGSNPMAAGKQQVIRWSGSYSQNATASLEFTNDGAQNWQVIDTNVALVNSQIAVLFPDTIITGRFRMTTNFGTFLSDSFPISPLLDLRVGYVCDSVLLFWNKPFNHDEFRLYRIAGDSLQLFMQTSSDHFFADLKESTHYAVAPLIGNQEGLKSHTINYATQGVGCYINNFLADLVDNNKGELKLQLGSLYKIKRVEIQKIDNYPEKIFESFPVTQMDFEYIDGPLHQGLNAYQALVELEDGTKYYSELATIVYSNDKPFILFPNPVQQGSPIRVLVDTAFGTTAYIYNAQGMLVRKILLEEKLTDVSTINLGKGVYFMRLTAADGSSKTYKFVVQ